MTRKLPPKPALIAALQNQPLRLSLLVGEAVDNAFDAGAHLITIAIGDDFISVSDDGNGVLFANLDACVRLADHAPSSLTRLGRYGAGIKLQALAAGDRFLIASISDDGRSRQNFRWSDVFASEDWEYPPAITDAAPKDSKKGTTVTISKLRRPLKPKELTQLPHDLARLFHPALIRGDQIIINGHAVDMLSEPLLTHIIDETLNFPGGRQAHVRGGLLADPMLAELNLVHVGYWHRVIIAGERFGTGNYQGTNRMFARVDLIDGEKANWSLGTFKDEISDENQKEKLAEEIERVLMPVLELCEDEQQSLDLEELNAILARIQGLEDVSTKRARRARERKEQEADKKKVKPEKPEKPERRRGDPGENSKARPWHRQLEIAVQDISVEQYGVGKFEPARTRKQNDRIVVPSQLPIIKQIRDDIRDVKLQAQIIQLHAVNLYQHFCDIQQFEIQEQGFGWRVFERIRIHNLLQSEAAA